MSAAFNYGYNYPFLASPPHVVFEAMTHIPDEVTDLCRFLRREDTPVSIVETYLKAFNSRCQRRQFGESRSKGHDDFEKTAIGGGMVRTLFQFARDGQGDKDHLVISLWALGALWSLITLGDDAEKRQLVQAYLNEHDALDFCLELVESDRLVGYQQEGMSGLRALAQECFLFEYISTEQTSRVLKKLCECILTGPEAWMEQTSDPETAWQAQMLFDQKSWASTEDSRKRGALWHATWQENAVWTLAELAGQYPTPKQQYFNHIIKQNPEIIDMLLQCAMQERRPWRPTTQVNSVSLKALNLMLNFPVEMVPGVKVEVDNQRIQAKLDAKWHGLMVGFKELTGCSEWCQRLIDVWVKLENEDLEATKQMLMRVEEDYDWPMSYSGESLSRFFHDRGIQRLLTLRLMTGVAYAAQDGDSITTNDLLNLLPISHSACDNVKTEVELDGKEDLQELSKVKEFNFPFFVKPAINHSNENMEEIVQVNPVTITGPTLHLRLLVILAERGVLDRISEWVELPEGVRHPGGLQKLQEIVSSKEIERSLLYIRARMARRRDFGNELFTEQDRPDQALFQFWSTAQLAAATVDFDQATKWRYHRCLIGARKELVLNLGNAAEMALSLERYDRAYAFASAALKLSKPEVKIADEPIGQAIWEKNKRRLARACAAVGKESSEAGPVPRNVERGFWSRLDRAAEDIPLKQNQAGPRE